MRQQKISTFLRVAEWHPSLSPPFQTKIQALTTGKK